MITGFMYGNIYAEEDRFERHAVFPKLLCNNAEDFSWVSRYCMVDPEAPEHLMSRCL